MTSFQMQQLRAFDLRNGLLETTPRRERLIFAGDRMLRIPVMLRQDLKSQATAL
jgi:hypothetical protein